MPNEDAHSEIVGSRADGGPWPILRAEGSRSYNSITVPSVQPPRSFSRLWVALVVMAGLFALSASADPHAVAALRAALVTSSGGPPRIPPVLSATELTPVRQNAAIKGRDGAQSGLFHDRSIWAFGDTVLNVPGHDGDSWADNTTSWTADLDAADGIVLTNDHLDGTGAPTEFIPFTRRERRFNKLHDPNHCQQQPCGAEYALWAGPVVPDPQRNRVLYFYMKIYRVIGNPGWTTIGTGIAVWTPGSPVVRPIESPGSPDPTLMFLQDEVGFTGGSLLEGGALYSYGCYPGFLVQNCQLARAPLADALDRSTWIFYAGHGMWSPNSADAVTVLQGGASNQVFFDPYLGDYVAIYSAPLDDDVMYRVSYSPWGPWSDQALLFTGVPGQNFDYAALSHPEFAEGDGQTQYVTYVRITGLFESEIRLVQVVFGHPKP